MLNRKPRGTFFKPNPQYLVREIREITCNPRVFAPRTLADMHDGVARLVWRGPRFHDRTADYGLLSGAKG
ncbi:MAG: hypothetical protein OXN89_14950 [Bryobacterales bacterium]|nr:hypothetical protein [Bryobacterales bacterium]